MRGAFSVVETTLRRSSIKVHCVVDIGLALGMQLPWTREFAENNDATLYSVDLNLKNFFNRSLCKYLPPRHKSWEEYQKTSDRAEWGYDPQVQDPLSWNDLTRVSQKKDPPIYSYGDDSHFLVHAHSTKFLEYLSCDIDVMLLDGDHRYMSVLNDLNAFKDKNGKIAFFDDIDTSFARNEVSMRQYIDHPNCLLRVGDIEKTVKGPGGTYYSEILEGAVGQEAEVGISEFENTATIPGKQGILTAIEDFVCCNPQYEFHIEKTGAGGLSEMTKDFKQCGVLILKSTK